MYSAGVGRRGREAGFSRIRRTQAAARPGTGARDPRVCSKCDGVLGPAGQCLTCAALWRDFERVRTEIYSDGPTDASSLAEASGVSLARIRELLAKGLLLQKKAGPGAYAGCSCDVCHTPTQGVALCGDCRARFLASAARRAAATTDSPRRWSDSPAPDARPETPAAESPTGRGRASGVGFRARTDRRA